MKLFKNFWITIGLFFTIALFSSCGSYIIDYSYLAKLEKENKSTKYPSFVVFKNKLYDTIKGDFKVKKRNNVHFNGQVYNFTDVDTYQDKYGFNIRYDGWFPIESVSKNFYLTRLIHGNPLSLYTGEFIGTSFTGVNNNKTQTKMVLMVVNINNPSNRQLLSPDLLKQFVTDDMESIELANSLFKTGDANITNDYRKVIQIVNKYNASKAAK